jgi:predicted metal-dependent hydrolase
LTSHYQQVTTGTVEPSKEKKKYWLQIIQFKTKIYLSYKNKNGLKKTRN